MVLAEHWSRITLDEFAEALNCSVEEVIPDLVGLILDGVILMRGAGNEKEYSLNTARLMERQTRPN
jgi:DNA-binding Lrp family transcriptional regulator